MTTIYENGIPRDATPEEKSVRTSPEARYTGCPVFVISDGFKFWCQNGRHGPESGHCG